MTALTKGNSLSVLAVVGLEEDIPSHHHYHGRIRARFHLVMRYRYVVPAGRAVQDG